MKRVILTVAEFLILVKVQNEVTFAYSEPDEYIEANDEKKTATDDLDEEMPELVLETVIFDDVIDSVQHYKDDELASDDPEMPAVIALLEKLEAVEEEPIAESQEEEATDDEVAENQEEAAADDQPEKTQPE
mgnify:CR=1 FL=1